MHANARGSVTALILGAMTVFSACSETPMGPQNDDAGGRTSGDNSSLGSAVQVLERSAPRRSTEQASRVIGPEGGVIRLEKAGLSIFFPPGALEEATEITLTAPAGRLLGYEFQPHGLRFETPVTVYQDLAVVVGTALDRQADSPLLAAYFEGPLRPSVEPKEIRPFRVLGALGVFEIEHFSGYVIATD